jgi:hypothetical protein
MRDSKVVHSMYQRFLIRKLEITGSPRHRKNDSIKINR